MSQKIAMGLESKEGALRALGEAFPEEKLVEIREELINDAKAEGALNLIKAEVSKQLMDLTGMIVGPDGTATPVDPVMAGGDVLGDGEMGEQPAGVEVDPAIADEIALGEAQIKQTLLEDAYGDQTPPRSTINRG
jgi:hypothetical protein